VAPTLTLPAFAARFDRALSFSGKPGNRALVLRSDEGTGGFVALQRMLITAFQQAGLKIPMPSNFTPHITLAYDEQNIAERAIEPIAWTVREFVLVHSEIGRGLPYMALRRWPLQNQ
jgi:2'-5' RNA ligase